MTPRHNTKSRLIHLPLLTVTYHDGRDGYHHTQEDDTRGFGKEPCSDETDNTTKKEEACGKGKLDPVGLQGR